MSETTFPDPGPRLRVYVESILAGSSVPAADREDIAEELYGHLWQRWRDALDAGASAAEAVETAIRSFGEAGRLGHEMTGAYHSRLYATTIGALLPAVAPPPGKLWGYRRLRLLLALAAVVELVLGWIGVWMLRPAISGQMADWFSSSRPIGRALAVALVAAVAAGYLVPYAAGATADPTQVSASDLNLQVSAVCTRDASGGVTAIDINTRLRWSRLDLFPYGLGQGNVVNSWQDGFEIGVSPAGGRNSVDWRTAWISIPSQFPLYLMSDQPHFTSPDGSVDGLLVTGPPQGLVSLDPYVPGSEGLQFAPGGLHAGWTYDTTERYQWQSVTGLGAGPAPTDPLVTIRYAHLDRFVVQALASCDRPGSGVPMPLPYPWASQ
jgi:hypothetical protein